MNHMSKKTVVTARTNRDYWLELLDAQFDVVRWHCKNSIELATVWQNGSWRPGISEQEVRGSYSEPQTDSGPLAQEMCRKWADMYQTAVLYELLGTIQSELSGSDKTQIEDLSQYHHAAESMEAE